ncbi:MAG: hypothetical protein Q9196_005912, partial [Gyalolechia fulgens]
KLLELPTRAYKNQTSRFLRILAWFWKSSRALGSSPPSVASSTLMFSPPSVASSTLVFSPTPLGDFLWIPGLPRERAVDPPRAERRKAPLAQYLGRSTSSYDL